MDEFCIFIELDKGLDLVDKAGVGGKNSEKIQKWLSNETNKNKQI